MSAVGQHGGERTALRIDAPVVIAGAVALVVGAALLEWAFNWRQATLLLIGGGLGVALYHAAFGFTGAWRAFIVERRGAGLRSQMLLLALTTAVVIPALSQGTLLGTPIGGALAGVGLSVVIGAALFGFGMQLGGGCGSGTLFTVGGGNVRMMVTLLFFIVGTLIGTLHLPWWLTLPSFGTISLPARLGMAEAIFVQLAICGAIAAISVMVERRRHGRLVPAARHASGGFTHTLLHGPWPLWWGAVALAALSVATLAVAGHTWSVTFAFGLWGAKALAALGVDVASWTFWTWPYTARALQASVFANTVSVMNFGILLGALVATGLAGSFAPSLRIPPKALVAAVIGGLLMGYGARLAFGCNIGALLSGIASGSVHGWLWFAAAFAGSIAGVRLRPWFGLDANPSGA